MRVYCAVHTQARMAPIRSQCPVPSQAPSAGRRQVKCRLHQQGRRRLAASPGAVRTRACGMHSIPQADVGWYEQADTRTRGRSR